MGAGVVDRDYRGELKILLKNDSQNDFHIKKGDRVGQMIIERIANPPVEVVQGLEDTRRGAGGFGSMGVNVVDIQQKKPLIIQQLWPFEGQGFEQEDGWVTVYVGKTHHIIPGKMKWIYLPFRIVGTEWFFISCCFNRKAMPV